MDRKDPRTIEASESTPSGGIGAVEFWDRDIAIVWTNAGEQPDCGADRGK